MKIYILTVLFLILSSCSARNQADVLDDVESFISEDPERALSVLDSLSSSGELPGHGDKARFALLYSMALDKNYIDSIDDSLINIAVDWYKRHGTADEKLKAYYYQGRIYQNAGDKESAMESFVKAEAYVEDAEDDVAAGLLYDAMSNIALEIFDDDSVLKFCRKAEYHYRKAGDKNRYAYALLGLAIYYTTEGQYTELSLALDTIRMFWNDLDIRTKDSYYQLRLGEFKETGQYEKLESGLEEYIREFPEDTINWMSVSEYYLVLGNARQALSSLEIYRNKNKNYSKEPAYYIHESNAYDSLDLTDSALAAYKNYQELIDSINTVIFGQDTKFLRERYEKDRSIAKSKYERAIIILSAVILLLVLLYIIHTLLGQARKREEEKSQMENDLAEFRRQYSALETEKQELERIIAENPPADSMSRKVLNDRLELLNKFFTAEISSDAAIDRMANKELSRLVNDRESFMYATRMTFAAAHPEFIRLLENKGLTEHEIEYCCLYMLGLKGKDIGGYIEKKRHYNDSSEIRKKLGLGEHDTNLGIYLKNILNGNN